MKKLINSPENVVLESIASLGAAFSDIIKIHTKPRFLPVQHPEDEMEIGIGIHGGRINHPF